MASLGIPVGPRSPARRSHSFKWRRVVTAKTTDSQGEFVFDFLPIGNYVLKIEALGFNNYERSGIHLVGSQQVRQTFELEMGATSQTIKVEGAAPLVNTVSAEQLQAFESHAVQELPYLAGMSRAFCGWAPV
jgi:hypothetical protein